MYARGLTNLLEGFIRFRLARFIVAAAFAAIAIPIALSGFAHYDIKVQRGVYITHVYTVTNADTGAYLSSKITLAGSDVPYIFGRDQFTPVLDERVLVDAGPVDVWYNDAPILTSTPILLAVQLYDASGAPATKYASRWYLHPDDERNQDLVPAGVCLAIALAFALAGVLLPAAGWQRGPKVATAPAARDADAAVPR